MHFVDGFHFCLWFEILRVYSTIQGPRRVQLIGSNKRCCLSHLIYTRAERTSDKHSSSFVFILPFFVVVVAVVVIVIVAVSLSVIRCDQVYIYYT